MMWDFNLDCWNNLDPDVYLISSKMLCIHYLVVVSQFAKFRKNWAVTV